MDLVYFMKWKGVLLGRKRNELYKKSHSSKTKMAFQVGGAYMEPNLTS